MAQQFKCDVCGTRQTVANTRATGQYWCLTCQAWRQITETISRPLQPGMLVAVISSLNPKAVRMIGRVVEDRGNLIEVHSDDQLEWEASVEHDFAVPESRTLIVPIDELRPIIEPTH